MRYWFDTTTGWMLRADVDRGNLGSFDVDSSSAVVNRHIDANLFEFTPPPGSKKVASLPYDIAQLVRSTVTHTVLVHAVAYAKNEPYSSSSSSSETPGVLVPQSRYTTTVQELAGVALVFVANYYDGPLGGLAAYEDRLCWFEIAQDAATGDVPEPRRYYLYEFTPEERLAEEERHRFFKEKVYTLWCAHLPRAERLLTVGETAGEFYARYPPEQAREYRGHPILGWFPESVLLSP